MQTEGSENVMEWRTILSETKSVENEKIVEFSLSSGSTRFDEFVINLSVGKHSGDGECNGNTIIKLNGRELGYYLFNKNLKTNGFNVYIEARTKPIPNIKKSESVNSLAYNTVNLMYQNSFNPDNLADPSKFIMTFPAEYTGTITVEIYAR